MYVTSSYKQYIYTPYSIFYDQEIKSRFWRQNKPEYTKIDQKKTTRTEKGKENTPGKKKGEREREREGSRSKKAEGVDDNGNGNGIDKRGCSRRQVTMSKLRT
jgi:hypothetical protein